MSYKDEVDRRFQDRENQVRREKSSMERLDMLLPSVGLSVKTTNAYEQAGLFTVRDLLAKSEEELRSIANVGDKTMDETYLCLSKLGFVKEGYSPPVDKAEERRLRREYLMDNFFNNPGS